MQLLCNDAVAKQARRQSYLQAYPILRLPYVENISESRSEPTEDDEITGRPAGAYLVYAVQAVQSQHPIKICRKVFYLPAFSSVFSISSFEMPNPSQYVICSCISRKMWETIAADY